MRWTRWVTLGLSVVLSVGLFGMVALAETKESAKPGSATAKSITLTVIGQKQGVIKGPNRDGSSAIKAYSHSIVSPRDPASGLPTGQRMHKPLVITKAVDKSSPLLASALVTNENLSKVELRFYNTSGNKYYQVNLTNATIAGLDQKTNDDGALVDVIAFTYQKIEWTWTDGGITAGDDWEAVSP